MLAALPKAQLVITGVLGLNSMPIGPNEFLHIAMGKGVTLAVSQGTGGSRRTRALRLAVSRNGPIFCLELRQHCPRSRTRRRDRIRHGYLDQVAMNGNQLMEATTEGRRFTGSSTQ